MVLGMILEKQSYKVWQSDFFLYIFFLFFFSSSFPFNSTTFPSHAQAQDTAMTRTERGNLGHVTIKLGVSRGSRGNSQKTCLSIALSLLLGGEET